MSVNYITTLWVDVSVLAAVFTDQLRTFDCTTITTSQPTQTPYTLYTLPHHGNEKCPILLSILLFNIFPTCLLNKLFVLFVVPRFLPHSSTTSRLTFSSENPAAALFNVVCWEANTGEKKIPCSYHSSILTPTTAGTDCIRLQSSRRVYMKAAGTFLHLLTLLYWAPVFHTRTQYRTPATTRVM